MYTVQPLDDAFLTAIDFIDCYHYGDVHKCYELLERADQRIRFSPDDSGVLFMVVYHNDGEDAFWKSVAELVTAHVVAYPMRMCC
ncbi:TPA_asm: hypothetical protein [ssRNA phage Gerhypos.3_25]|uniref:Uncharacterized protein n=2 Tax=Fiersviridae TaxID=2842319 RepID=A0A8S5KZF4_9VIRU|nr:hypothetical protein QIK76_gp1 [ssRNA phage Gerhypos.3_25]QDH87001.1 MAG: hypothetical protein H3Bulk42356_000001 [Leviviridae sp.]DAD50461.1 TPA_asm: hypothetical protein [ssRNA phage Gerhypos.3_25]